MVPTVGPPPGFQAQPTGPVHYYTPVQAPSAGSVPYVSPVQASANGPVQLVNTTQPVTYPFVQPVLQAQPGPTQDTTLPQVFNVVTLQDPATGAWNMDTGASSHLNNSITSLSENFNTCMYPSISVGDGHSILVTNTGHIC
ncbi:hypothetical protein Tco_0739245 [Tanacetum coccineum]